MFETFEIGDCKPTCDSDEQKFEFLIFKQGQNEIDFNLTWELKDVSNGMKNALTVRNGMLIPNERVWKSLVHIKECLPRNRCYLFFQGVPYDIPRLLEWESRSISLDGIFYRRGDYQFWDVGGRFNDSTLMGDNCKKSKLFAKDESLFELTIDIQEKPNISEELPFNFSFFEVFWSLSNETSNKIQSVFKSKTNVQDFTFSPVL